MSEEQAQKTWNEYHARIKSRRLVQVKVINEQLKKAGITSNTDLVLDFNFFTPKKSGAEGIKEQLSENYEISIKQDGEYWHIDGTTRPYSITLNSEQHIAWVEFMHDVALSYGCIFSVWTVTDPKTNKKWSNEKIETKFD
ncbi:MAG: hypothetical protein JKX98_11260 [Alcanivoracaceae bacterium]|nr:hypothetical protein [Alcanivoracaceae bacterium]